MSNVVSLTDHRQPELLATIAVYRMPDGTLRASLQGMAERQIESKETIRERCELAASWMRQTADDLATQWREFEEPRGDV